MKELAPVFPVQRHLFLPDVIWPHTGRRYEAVDRTTNPDGWSAYAASDKALVTQWDDGNHSGLEPGQVATSSSSAPSLVAAMLHDLGVQPGDRVLDLGVGTGWTTALLTHTAGAGHVAGVEYDPAVAQQAMHHLKAAHVDAFIGTGDGADGWAPNAPYDRIHVGYAVTTIQPAWLEQTRPGGTIVMPWRTRFVHHGAVLKLTVHDAHAATGRFTRYAQFMQSRPERRPWPIHDAYVPSGHGGWPDGTNESTTTLRRDEVFDSGVAEFVIGALVPDAVFTIAQGGEGYSAVWLYSLTDLSWAVIFYDNDPESEVYQGGPRRLFDEVTDAYLGWVASGAPGYTDLALEVDRDGQRLILP